jgi:lipopolysaccharide transport system ATP-binding protein
MSDEPIIRVENLGKRYSLRHLRDQRYVALRDVLVEKATGLFRRSPKGRSKLADRRSGNGSDTPDNREQITDNRASSKEDFWALKDVSFEVKRGEVVGIIGRNGAGKSTLLKILSRITDPTEGKVTLKGRVASLLEVGTGFHPELTGRENIYLNGAILGMSRAEIKKKFDEIVAFAETEKFLDTPVKRYSSGMYVRLAFAVAAHLEPEILVIDEVLAVGDAEFQKKCLGKMRDVSRGGRTVLFVSHQMGSVRALCSKGVFLRAGSLASIGPVDEVIHSYMASLDVDDRSEPLATKAKYLKQAVFINGANEQTRQAVGIGGDTTIRVVFALPRPSRFPVVGLIARRMETGEAVFGSNSRVCGQPELSTPTTEAKIDVLLSRLNLVPGFYLLDVWVGCDNDDLEGIDGLLELEVVDNNPYGTGKPPFTNYGACFVPMRFEAILSTTRAQ